MAGEFGIVLRKLRRDAGLTQTQLAERCNFTQPMIRHYETGVRLPRKDNIYLLARALNKKPKQLAMIVNWEKELRRSGRCDDAEEFLAAFLITMN